MTKKNNDDDVIFIQALATVLRNNDLTELQVERQDGDDRSLNIHLSRAIPVPRRCGAGCGPWCNHCGTGCCDSSGRKRPRRPRQPPRSGHLTNGWDRLYAG